MVWKILICAFAAMGFALLIWAFIGLLLLPFSLKNSCILVSIKNQSERLEQQTRVLAWLIGCGLLHGKLLLVDDGTDQEATAVAEKLTCLYSWAEQITAEELEDKLKLELTEREGSRT